MKSGEYVARVVQAYRLILDASPNTRLQALTEARELLARTYSRRTTAGFFLGARPQELLAPQDTGNIGLFLGKLSEVQESRATLRLLEPLSVGDRLRLHDTTSGERQAFTLKELSWQGKAMPVADAGDVVTITLPESARAGDLLYKVGETTPGGSRSEKKWREILFELAKPTLSAPPPVKNLAAILKSVGKPSGKSRAKTGPPLTYVRVRSITEALEVQRQGLWHLVVELTEENFNDYLRNLRPVKRLKGLIWQLPTIIFEKQLAFYRQALNTLLDGGWRNFMVGNFSHLHLLQEAQAVLVQPDLKKRHQAAGSASAVTAAGKISTPQSTKLTLYSDYTLHCLNSQAFEALQNLGVTYVTLSVEADKETLKLLLRNLPESKLLAYVFGHLPLMISRAPLPEGKKALRLTSPRGEQFRLLSRGELTYLVAKFPYLMQKPLAELLPLGLTRIIIDTNNSGLPASEIGSVVHRLLSGPQISGGSSFNYFRGLE